MPKKLLLVFIGIIFFSPFFVAHADVIINEIMYNPTGGDTNVEWVELYNNGASSVDLSSWYVTDYDTSWHYHAISPENSTSIPANGYAVLVHTSQIGFDDFKTKMPSYSGLLFRASFTLGNISGRIGLSSDHTNITSDTSYTGSSDTDDNDRSLQLIAGSFVGALQTPGSSNGVGGSGLGSGGTSYGGSTSSAIATAPETKPKVVEIPKIKTQIKNQPLAFANIPTIFEATTLGYSGEPLIYGKYYWNFGDGDSRETKVTNQEKFYHTYYYPGTYTVSLEYYTNYYSEIPDAVSKTTIKVQPEDVIISNVGDEKDFFVELTNNTDANSDISKWALVGNGNNYVLPKNTILESKDSLTVSGKITKFTLADKNSLKLMNSQGEVVYDYSLSKNPQTSSPALRSTLRANNAPIVDTVKSLTPEAEEAVPLGADVSKMLDTIPAAPNHSYIPIISFVLFLGIASSAVYFIRQRKTPALEGEDFDILDE